VTRRLALAIVASFVLAAPHWLDAQIRPVTPPRRDTIRARPDTSRRDSTADSLQTRELIKWNPTDSVMEALMAREGYTATKYQGDVVIFNALTRTLELRGNKAGVTRDQTVLVGDSIMYNDSTKIMVARGDTVILRDPQRQSADVVARGQIIYSVLLRQGCVTNVSTSVESGQQWFVQGANACFVSDTSRGPETAFYARNASITSCDDSIPDYHFQAKEVKMISKNIMVARPAVLYIGEVPVMWLPFIFQDMRSGRRSGVLTPRFGVSELLRSSPSYRRHAENLGYYFALNDYMDAEFALDWRSDAGASEGDPGWVRLNGDMQYRWLDRFVSGRLALFRHSLRDGSSNTGVSWGHQQSFSQSTSFSANVNYVTNTRIQRNTAFNPAAVLATISSQANYQTKIGAAALSLGGTRTQYPGRSEVAQSFPNFSVTVPTLQLASWLDWTPGFNFQTDQRFNIDQVGDFSYRYLLNPDGSTDSVRRKRDTRNTSSSFSTPLKIGGFSWSNSFSLIDQEANAPQIIVVRDQNDSSVRNERVFAKTFSTQLDWQTGITLPSFLQGSLKISPSVSFQNVDSRAFWVRTEQSGGRFVHQNKRAVVGLTASPTLFALFPGFGPVTRFRHSITPVLSYNYAPSADISTEFLRALNMSKQGYLGALAQNRLTLGLSHSLEAKLRTTDTSSAAEPKKIRILAMNFSPLSYDFERARQTHRSGFVTDNITSDFTSDLLPSFRASVGYSLYQGDIMSDSARFKPFRERIDASFTMNSQSGIFGALSRVFGRAVPQKNPQIERVEASPDDALANRVASTPVAGISARNRQYGVPTTEGWQATLTYSSTRQRPPTGDANVIEEDPTRLCLPFQANPIIYQQCIDQQAALGNPGGSEFPGITAGGQFFRTQPRDNLQSQMSFHLTPKWSGSWVTNYDFQAKKFGSHQVSLQRELHDWRAIFAFTQAPNGNFAFNFFIALNAEPDLKFNYDKQTYRPVTR
jgi:lipopolysaccharide transport LptD-like protein